MSGTSGSELKRIVILGGGTAGWMTAAACARLLAKDKYSVQLIESEEIGRVGVGEATLPHLRYFIQRLGIDEVEFMRETQATFKAGIEFSNWNRKGDSYLHPFGEFGSPMHNVDFHHFWLKRHANGDDTAIDAYSLPVMASLAGKFDFPSGDLESIRSTYAYAYHIDAGLCSRYLRKFSETRGIGRIEGKVVDVAQRVDGQIESLLLEDGRNVEGDFFIDCSGFIGLLISKVFDIGFESWDQWLMCNSAVALPTQYTKDPLPYTKAIAQDAGWIWRIPLQHRLGNGHVYCDSHVTDQQALDALMEGLLGEPIAEPMSFKFCAGKRKKAWHKNCVAVGLASGFLEPLESTTLYLIQSAIMKLFDLFPEHTGDDPDELELKAFEFNRFMDNEMFRIRDFLILHYHATERTDTEFWTHCKEMQVPDSLSEKIELFREFGQIDHYEYGLFLEPSWLAVYVGQGIIPESYDPRVDQMDEQELIREMSAVKERVADAVVDMPMHGETLDQFLRKGRDESEAHPNRSRATMSLYGRQG